MRGGVVTTETLDLNPAKDSKETPRAKLNNIRLSHCVTICPFSHEKHGFQLNKTWLPVLSCSLYVTWTCCWNLRACVVRQGWTPREGLAASGSPLFHHQLAETQALRAPSKTYPTERGNKWVCLKMVYTPNYSHLIGIRISKTIGFRGTLFSDKPKWKHIPCISGLISSFPRSCACTLNATTTAAAPTIQSKAIPRNTLATACDMLVDMILS